jgi:hypothetical protein
LHAEKTQILNRVIPARPTLGDLHAEKTQILDRAALGLPPARSDRTTTPRVLPPLHAEETRILDRSQPPKPHDVEAGSLHAEKTRILDRSQPPLQSLADDGHARTRTMHGNDLPHTTERQPRVVIDDEDADADDEAPTGENSRGRRDTHLGFGEGPDEATRIPGDDDDDDL